MKTVSPIPSPQPNYVMQRVKVGMVGLAAVVLLIGLASAIFSAASREKPIVAAGAPKDAVANMTIANLTQPAESGKEPLVELGVTPGAAETHAAPAPAQPR